MSPAGERCSLQSIKQDIGNEGAPCVSVDRHGACKAACMMSIVTEGRLRGDDSVENLFNRR
jgi:hypothetical protein